MRNVGRSSIVRSEIAGVCSSASRIFATETGKFGPSFLGSGFFVPSCSTDEDSGAADGGGGGPVQALGEYFSHRGGSRALGAASEGAYPLPPEAESIRPRLDRLFDCLENVRRRCPEGCNKRLPLTSIILHLNDDHHWTREQIVEWLKKD